MLSLCRTCLLQASTESMASKPLEETGEVQVKHEPTTPKRTRQGPPELDYSPPIIKCRRSTLAGIVRPRLVSPPEIPFNPHNYDLDGDMKEEEKVKIEVKDEDEKGKDQSGSEYGVEGVQVAKVPCLLGMP